MAKKAIGYVRVSTKGQEDGYGREVQEEAIRNYAAEHGYKLIEIRYETESGAKERDVLNDICYDNDGVYSAVIVFKSDRVARDMKLYFYYLYLLERRNIELISVEEDFGGDAVLANVYRAMMLFVAEQERKNIDIRTGKGRINKARYGAYSGGKPPYGYKAEKKMLAINEAERDVVVYIFAMAERGASMGKIAKVLNENGFRKRNGSEWDRSQINAILKNERFYRGYYKYGELEEMKGLHQPILED